MGGERREERGETRVGVPLLCTFIRFVHHSCCICLIHVWHVQDRRSIPAVQKGEPSIPMRWAHLNGSSIALPIHPFYSFFLFIFFGLVQFPSLSLFKFCLVVLSGLLSRLYPSSLQQEYAKGLFKCSVVSIGLSCGCGGV